MFMLAYFTLCYDLSNLSLVILLTFHVYTMRPKGNEGLRIAVNGRNTNNRMKSKVKTARQYNNIPSQNRIL